MKEIGKLKEMTALAMTSFSTMLETIENKGLLPKSPETKYLVDTRKELKQGNPVC